MISPFHGGLEWQDDIQAQATQSNISISSAQQAIAGAGSSSTLASIDSLNKRDINAFFNPRPSTLSIQERYDLCASVGEEIIKESELMELI